ncbi:MAG: hypothetical protein ACD_3C00226G0010 [uncultured bacterium (gcode 4)]|uniref:Uncharacterized protein n=1 Tax=uncultured bacterium (gcode 4) TaxID=1234023 RepID=K2F7Z8_9BACT|nr:MAG: hypothetical protein ACD_3C00226G0010 [uncultured bacterium (gcode 4)]
MNKIIRSICYFGESFNHDMIEKSAEIENILRTHWFEIQTKRICLKNNDWTVDPWILLEQWILLSLWDFSYKTLDPIFEQFLNSQNITINLDLTNETIEEKHINLLYEIINENPSKTFNFTYTFNNKTASPYFPSAKYEKNWFSIWLQPTDLSENCKTLDEWLLNMEEAWNELIGLFKNDSEFLWIDSSVAPLFEWKSSLIDFINRLWVDFSSSVTTDIYTQITNFIKRQNPKPVWLCWLMFPCLEDFELASEYSVWNFSIERNIFLSLHSWLWIDTYPIWINQNKKKVADILKLVQALSNKYSKPLSVRFVSDWKAKIWEMTDFKNQYLKDVIVREL